MTRRIRKQAATTSTVQTTPTSAISDATVPSARSAIAAVSSAPDPTPSSATIHGATARGGAAIGRNTGTGAVARLIPMDAGGLCSRRGRTNYRRGATLRGND